MAEKNVLRRILMIDDEEDFLEIAAFWFRKKGHQVMTAINCETGLSLIKTLPLDVVFLDMRMPNVDGAETLKRIRQIKKDLPVIIVTAYADDAMIQKANALGISGIFRKGSSFDSLQVVMEVALKSEAAAPPRPPA